MARYDYKCSECGGVVEVTCSPHDLAENWPECPTDGCTGSMHRVWASTPTIWKTDGGTQVKRGLPDVR